MTTNKKCKGCRKTKSLKHFYPRKNRKTHHTYCKPCSMIRAVKWVKENKVKHQEYIKRYKKKNAKKFREYQISYRLKNAERLKKYQAQWRKNRKNNSKKKV